MNKDIVEAVRSQLGAAQDNLHRAKAAARGRDASQAWGESGQTLQQIMDGYAAEVERWERALKEAGG